MDIGKKTDEIKFLLDQITSEEEPFNFSISYDKDYICIGTTC